MDRRTRHRVLVYGRNQRGTTVELRIHQAPTPEAAITLAQGAVVRPRLGALAYTTALDDNGEETGVPVVHGRWGVTPPDAP